MAFLAPNARWMGRTPTGEPVINGYLYTYRAGSEIPKVTYEDFEEKIANENPIRLDDAGEANIYWLDDEYYRIILFTEDMQEVYDQDDYPYLRNQNVSPITDNTNKNNIVRNPQFTYWTNGETLTNITGSTSDYDYIADDWLFRKTNLTSNINATQVRLNLTDASIPGDPVDVMDINCTVVGTLTEDRVEIYQKYDSVRTFANRSVTISFSSRVVGALSGQISVHVYQRFGSGGTPSSQVDNSFGTFDLTQAFQTFNRTITLDSLTGKTEGTDDNSYIELAFQFPNNVLFEIQLGTVQFIAGDVNLPFDYMSQNDQYLRLYRNRDSFFQTGDYKLSLATSQEGWVSCNNGTIGNPSSGATFAAMYTKALFIAIFNSVVNMYAPIFNSDGTVGTRTTAEADYNLNKRMSLTKNLGRALAGYNPNGVATATKDFTGDTGNNALQLDDNSFFYTGTAVMFSNVGGALPTTSPQITNVGTYFVIQSASNRIQLATTLAQAVSGTPNITVSSVGTGRNIVSIPGVSKAMGYYDGEYNDSLLPAGLPAHTHANTAGFAGTTAAFTYVSSITGGAVSGLANSATASPVSLATTGTVTMTNASFGSSAQHNNVQPTFYASVLLKL